MKKKIKAMEPTGREASPMASTSGNHAITGGTPAEGPLRDTNGAIVVELQGPDLFTAYMEHLQKWMPLDGIWQTCYGTETGPRGYEPDRFEALMSSWFGLGPDGSRLAPDGLHPYPYEHLTPAAGPNGRWHVVGGHGRDVLWRRLMVPVREEVADE